MLHRTAQQGVDAQRNLDGQQSQCRIAWAVTQQLSSWRTWWQPACKGVLAVCDDKTPCKLARHLWARRHSNSRCQTRALWQQSFARSLSHCATMLQVQRPVLRDELARPFSHHPTLYAVQPLLVALGELPTVFLPKPLARLSCKIWIRWPERHYGKKSLCRKARNSQTGCHMMLPTRARE